MHNVSQRFRSVSALRSAMWHEFADAVPDEGEFNGFFFRESNTPKSGWSRAKIWILCMITSLASHVLIFGVMGK